MDGPVPEARLLRGLIWPAHLSPIRPPQPVIADTQRRVTLVALVAALMASPIRDGEFGAEKATLECYTSPRLNPDVVWTRRQPDMSAA